MARRNTRAKPLSQEIHDSLFAQVIEGRSLHCCALVVQRAAPCRMLQYIRGAHAAIEAALSDQKATRQTVGGLQIFRHNAHHDRLRVHAQAEDAHGFVQRRNHASCSRVQPICHALDLRHTDNVAIIGYADQEIATPRIGKGRKGLSEINLLLTL